MLYNLKKIKITNLLKYLRSHEFYNILHNFKEILFSCTLLIQEQTYISQLIFMILLKLFIE